VKNKGGGFPSPPISSPPFFFFFFSFFPSLCFFFPHPLTSFLPRIYLNRTLASNPDAVLPQSFLPCFISLNLPYSAYLALACMTTLAFVRPPGPGSDSFLFPLVNLGDSIGPLLLAPRPSTKRSATADTRLGRTWRIRPAWQPTECG